MKRTIARRTRKNPVAHRGFAYYSSGTSEEPHEPGQVPAHDQPTVQAKWQQIANNSPRVVQLKAYQEMAAQNKVVQRYEKDIETKFLVSHTGKAVLKEDGSKELYMPPNIIQDVNTDLRGMEVTNFKLEGENALHFRNTDYQKVVPVFNIPQERTDKRFKLFGVTPQLLQDQKDTVTGQVIPQLTEITQHIEQDMDKETLILPKIKEYKLIAKAGRDLGQKLVLYCKNQFTKNEILAELGKRIQQLEQEAMSYNTNQPFLDTSCGYLKDTLLDQSKGNAVDPSDKSTKKTGNFHSIDFSHDKDDDAPWENHFATILLTDEDDSVTLEDAAGRGSYFEKTHWHYRMYGSEQDSFENKTTREFDRRKQQQKDVIKNGFNWMEAMGFA